MFISAEFLSELQQSEDLWHEDSELDVDFIEKLCFVCENFVNENPMCKLFDVHGFIVDSKIMKADYKIDYTVAILNKLIYENRIEMSPAAVKFASITNAMAYKSHTFKKIVCNDAMVPLFLL